MVSDSSGEPRRQQAGRKIVEARTGGNGGEEKKEAMPVLQKINETNELFSIRSEFEGRKARSTAWK